MTAPESLRLLAFENADVWLSDAELEETQKGEVVDDVFGEPQLEVQVPSHGAKVY